MNAAFLWSSPHYVPDPDNVSTSQKWDLIRMHRNIFLSQSDWTQLPDATLTIGEKTAWTTYRQTLRDLPQDYASPDDVTFPEQP